MTVKELWAYRDAVAALTYDQRERLTCFCAWKSLSYRDANRENPLC